MYGPSPAAPTRFKRKKKTKTFSGCWTCRARRIKCDERRPICERCSRSGFDCEGYGVRLLWMNARHHGRTGSEEMPLHQAQERLSVRNHCGYSNRTDSNDVGGSRSPFLETTTIRPISPTLRESIADFSNHTNSFISSDNGEAQSDKALCSLPIDSQFPPEPNLNVHVEGLRIDGSSQPTPPNTAQRLAQLFNPLPREREPGDNESSSSDAFLFSQHGDNCSAAMSPFELDHHRSQTRSDPQLDEEFSSEFSIDDNITHTNDVIPISDELAAREDSGSLENMDLPSSYRQPTGLHSTKVALNYHKDSFMIKRSPLIIQEPTCPSPQKGLIHHWIFGLCKNMVPVDLVHNPFRGVYLPFMFNSLDSPVTQSSNLAIFHGICAVSAENLICLGKGQPEVNEPIATLHNYLAVKHLQSALQIQPRIDDIAPIFTAILICILRDTVTGQAWDWRRHIQGALSCIPNPREIGTVQPGSSLHIVLEQFLCLSIFGNVTTTYDLFALIDRIPESLSYMNQYHGVNKFMLQSVLRINQYAATLGTQHPTTLQHERAKNDFNNSFVDLEHELMAYLHAPASISLEIHHHRDGIIALHYRHVYYIALLVHFKRKVHRVSIGSMEEMVGRAIRHLELAEEVGASSNGCIWLWPCLVVTAECNTLYTKSRALAWFKLKKRHGFKNVNTGARILEKFWEWRDENPEKASYTNWQSFIQETEEDVVPL